jgi:hypothetical protein
MSKGGMRFVRIIHNWYLFMGARIFSSINLPLGIKDARKTTRC